jgi:mono/diheme cytochrome c family protein
MRIVKILGAGLALLLVAAGGAVGYASSTAESKLQFPDTPAPALAASTDPAVIEQGRYLVHGPAHCAQCHSTDDREHPEKITDAPLDGGLEFAMGPLGTRYGRNLTPDATGIGDLTDEQVARTIRTGVLHDGELSFFMRFSAARLSDEDIVAVLSYLRSLEPVANEVPRGEWKLFGKVLLTYAFPPMAPRSQEGPDHVPAGDGPSLERGEYLAEHVMVCTTCHSEFDMTKFEVTGPKAGGSLPDPSHGSDTDMEFVAPNLTSHETGYTGKVSEDEFLARIRSGRTYPSSIMPWENFGAVTDDDLRSVYRYLKSLPPVDNDPGPSYRKQGWTPEDAEG